jgi:hypothetical protein
MAYVCYDCIEAFELLTYTIRTWQANASCEVCGPLFDRWHFMSLPVIWVTNDVVPRLMGSPSSILVKALIEELGQPTVFQGLSRRHTQLHGDQ